MRSAKLDAVQIRVAAQTAVLVKQLRGAWDAMMAHKVAKPNDAFTEKEREMLDIVVSLMHQQ